MALKTATPKQIKTEAQSQARKKKTQEIAQKYEQKHAEEAKKAAPAATPNTTISNSSTKSKVSTTSSVAAVKKATTPIVATSSDLVKSVTSKMASSDLTQIARSKANAKQDNKTNSAQKALTKAINNFEDVLNSPPVTQAKSMVNQNKNINYGDFFRSAFDKENIDKRNAEIPVLKNDRELINYYESIPNYNAFQRLTSFEKNNAYKQKQALTSDYQYAKDASVPSLLNQYNMSEDDLYLVRLMADWSDFPKKYFKDEMKKVGANDTDIDYLFDYVARKGSQSFNENIQNAVGKNTATKALGTTATFPLNPIESLTNVAKQGVSYLSGKPLTNDVNYTQSIRDTASKDLGNVGKFAYGVGTSIGDMGTAIGLAALTGGGSTLSAGAMGLEKASDVINEGIERNLTPDQIMAEGITSGITTALTEKIPMGKWDDIAEAGFSGAKGLAYAKELGKKIVASALPEAGQEAAEDIADTIADAIITGDKSKLNTTIRAYQATGLSHEEAVSKALIEYTGEVALDALAGAISGGVLGGGKSVISSLGNNANTSNFDELSNNPALDSIDNATNAAYDEGKGENLYDNTIWPGVRENIEGNQRPDILGASRENEEGRMLGRGNNRVLGEPSVTPEIRQKMDDAGIKNFDLKRTDSAVDFSLALDEGRKISNNTHGVFVSAKSPEEVQGILDNGGKVFLTNDDTAGLIVTADGDIEGVFSNSALAKKIGKTGKAFNDLMATAIANGGNKLDCYGDRLARFYASVGFEPVAVSKYLPNKPWSEEMDAWKAEQAAKKGLNSPDDINTDVYVMKLRDGWTVDDVINAMKTNSLKEYADSLDLSPETINRNVPEEYLNLPEDDVYDGLLQYRDSLMKQPTSEGAFFNDSNLYPTIQETADNGYVNEELPQINPVNETSYSPETQVGPSRLLPTIDSNNEFNNRGKTSRFALRTLKDSDTFKMREESSKWLNEQTNSGLFNYDTIVNKETVENACENLSKDFDGEVDRLQRTTEGLSATDVAESMVVLDLLTEQAEKTGDFSKVKEWAKAMQEKVTGMAQGLQLLSHFTRTASSTIMKVEKMADIKAKNLSAKEKKIATQYSKVLDNILKKIGYDGSMDANNEVANKTYQQIWQEVYNSLARESSSVFDDFTNADIDYLARLIQNNASEKMIYDALSRKFSTGHFEISDADIKAVIDLFNQRDKVGKNSKAANDLENQAYEIMSKYLGDATFKEKWNNYRYLAMLGNPRTHIRNFAGNLLFNITTNVKDNLAGILEEFNDSKFTNQDRTRTFVSWTNPKDAALMRATQKDFFDNAYIPATDNSNKYTMDTDIKRHQKVFKEKGAGKLMNYLVDKNGEFLDKEDTFAIKNKYRRVLAGYLKANGKTADILTSKNKADVEFMDRARKFAVEQAKIATFHEDSAFADLLNATSRMARESDSAGAKALNVAIEAVFPFKKTPVNIFKQGAIEYNPVAQAVKLIKNYKQYKTNPSEMIDSIAKGLSGSGIIALGAALASKGILRGSGKDEEDYAQGEQEYSINVGNRSFTIDWMAPTALPLFVGAEAYKWWQDNVAAPATEEEGKKFDINKGLGGFADALLSIGNPIMDLSMMQGLSNAFNSAASATNVESGGKLASFGTGLVTGYLGQAVPTLAGQVARIMDPTRRSTYTGQPYGSVTDTAEKQLLKQWNKIPVLSMFNEPYINTSGEEEKNEDLGLGVAGRAIQNMLLPGYYSKTHENEVINELSELTDLATESVDGFKQSQIFPKAPDKKYNGEQLNRKDYTKAATIKGKTTTKNLKELFASDLYQNATPAEQVTLVHDLNNFSNQLYEHKMYGKVIDSSTYKGKYDAYMENGMQGYLDYIQGKAEEKQEKEENKEKNDALSNAGISSNSKLGKELKQSADINAAIEKATGVSNKERQSTMEKLDNSSIDKAQITTSAKGGGTRVDWTKAVPYLTDMGLSSEERGEILYNTGKISDNEMNVMRDLGYSGVAQYYDNAYYGDTRYGDKDGNREKKEVISYLESLGSSPDDINMWLSYYGWKADYKGK